MQANDELGFGHVRFSMKQARGIEFSPDGRLALCLITKGDRWWFDGVSRDAGGPHGWHECAEWYDPATRPALGKRDIALIREHARRVH